MKQLNVRLDEEIVKEVKKYAISNGIPTQEVVKLAILQLLNASK